MEKPAASQTSENHATPAPGGVVAVPVEITVFGGTLRAQIPVPSAAVSAGQMLPMFHSIGDAVIHLSIKAVEREGKSISCRMGCAACCRQFVPISETEARELIDLVSKMPEPRRSQIRERFAAAVGKIDAGGLRDRLMNPESHPAERMRTVAIEYFGHWIDCPFLENEMCSVHPQRPLACREYLVTSPAENCSTLSDIDGVRVPNHASLALCRLDEKPTQTLVRTVPLAMIFEWAKTAPPEPAGRPGTEIMAEFLRYLGTGV